MIILLPFPENNHSLTPPAMAVKKEQRRQKKAEKAAAFSEKWAVLEGGPSLGGDSVELPADEWFAVLRENLLEKPAFGKVMDGLMRNTIRFTVEAWTRQFAALPVLQGRTRFGCSCVYDGPKEMYSLLGALASLLTQRCRFWLLLTDEDRVIQGKFYGFGGQVALGQSHADIVERSRNLFREAVPFLLQGGGAEHWVFSRSMTFNIYNMNTQVTFAVVAWIQVFNGSVDDAIGFPSYDPLNCLTELPEDVPSGVRCTEAFLFLAGDFPTKDDFCSRGAILGLLHELNSPAGNEKLLVFWVCAARAKVSKEKLGELKGVHIPVKMH